MTDISRPKNYVHNHEERTCSHRHPVVFRRVSTVVIAERWPTLKSIDLDADEHVVAAPGGGSTDTRRGGVDLAQTRSSSIRSRIGDRLIHWLAWRSFVSNGMAEFSGGCQPFTQPIKAAFDHLAVAVVAE